MSDLRTVPPTHRSELVVPLPRDCTPIETVMMVRPDGQLALSVFALPFGGDVAELVRAEQERLTAVWPGLTLDLVDDEAGAAMICGLVRAITAPSVLVRSVCSVDGGWGYVATGWCPSEPASAIGELEDLVVAAVAIRRSAPVQPGDPVRPEPPRRPVPTDAAWRAPRLAWSEDPAGPVTAGPPRTFTIEMMAAAGRLSGARTVPGVDFRPLLQLGGRTFATVLDTATRSLIAAGAAHAEQTPNGPTVSLTDDALSVIVDHDLLVQVVTTAPDSPGRVSFAARPDAAAVVAPTDLLPGGMVTVQTVEVDDLVDAILGACGSPGSEATASPVSVARGLVVTALRRDADGSSSPRSYDDLGLTAAEREALIALETASSCTVRTVHRRSGAFVGGDLWLAVGQAGIFRLDDEGADRLHIVPLSSRDLRAAILDVLPGGGVDAPWSGADTSPSKGADA